MGKKCRSLNNSLMIGGVIIAAVVVFSKKECREKVIREAKQTKETVCDSIRMIRDNREQIFEQIRSTANDVSVAIQGITKDLQQIKHSASQLKDNSSEIVEATKGAVEEVKNLS